MASTRARRSGHDRGRLLVDLAVMLADGGKAISDLCALRDQASLFGEVVSVPTAWRTLEASGADELAAHARLVRAGLRCHARALTLREKAAPTYKKGFGFHPLLVYLDATGEALARRSISRG